MKKTSLALLLSTLLVMSAGKGNANPTVQAHLTGAAEVGGGDPHGSGDVLITLSPGGDRLCFSITVAGITAATGANLCKGAAGANGPIVATLTAPSNGSTIDCVGIDGKLLKDIQQHPEQYYVNVINTDYPDGAVRGQLSH
jgi:hypothetical protein